ncbi:MAG: glycosyltransferase [Candidatus Krumholzibacteria bacterium]|nr:glycosyltransferase [Candidatus Krumholzibacteria bacterium]
MTSGPVAIVAVGELFGGAERHILGLGAFLRECGRSPRVILFHDRELASCCRRDGLPVHVLPTRSAWDLAGPRRLGELLARHDVQLVHVHGYKAAVNAALAPGRFAVAATVHGQGEPTWRNPRAFGKDRLYRALEVWACRRRRAVVCFVTADLQRRHGHRYRRLVQVTIPNGITPLACDDFPVRPTGLLRDRLQALMVGRLTAVKGIDLALDALAKVPADVPWHLNLIGEGGLRPALVDQVRRLGLQDRVSFLGFRRDVYALMAHSDLLIMSSYHEGLPYTLLEAMSLGLPVLASNVGGLAEVLRHEKTGLLVPPGDVPALAAALVRLGRDSDLRRRLGKQAAAVQRESYTLAAMGQSYLGAYAAATAV